MGGAVGLVAKEMFRAVYRCPINCSILQTLPVQEVQYIEVRNCRHWYTSGSYLQGSLCLVVFSVLWENTWQKQLEEGGFLFFVFLDGLRWCSPSWWARHSGGSCSRPQWQEHVTAVSYMAQPGTRDLSVPELEADTHLNSCPTNWYFPLRTPCPKDPTAPQNSTAWATCSSNMWICEGYFTFEK